MKLISLFEYLGIFMFAFSGASVALEEKLDYLGIFFLAAVTALGGGLIRDAVISNGNIYAFKSGIPYIFIFMAVAIVIKNGCHFKDSLFAMTFDAIGLAAFTVSAGHNAIVSDYNFLTTIFCCFATAVGGGMIRDIVVNRKPYVLRKEVYAVLSILGAAYQYALKNIVNTEPLIFTTFMLVFLLRMYCITKDINLPIAKHETK